MKLVFPILFVILLTFAATQLYVNQQSDAVLRETKRLNLATSAIKDVFLSLDGKTKNGISEICVNIASKTDKARAEFTRTVEIWANDIKVSNADLHVVNQQVRDATINYERFNINPTKLCITIVCSESHLQITFARMIGDGFGYSINFDSISDDANSINLLPYFFHE